MRQNEHQLVVIADYDYGDVESERKIIEGAGFTLVAAQCKSEDDVIDIARNAYAVITQYAYVGARAINAFTRCRVVARYGTGVDIVDVDAATRRNILVTIAGFQSGQPIYRLHGRMLGLLSFGAIARAIAARAAGFGMRVITSDRYLSPADIAAHHATPVSFDELIEGMGDRVQHQAGDARTAELGNGAYDLIFIEQRLRYPSRAPTVPRFGEGGVGQSLAGGITAHPSATGGGLDSRQHAVNLGQRCCQGAAVFISSGQ